jgi:chemotaxis signal transduction protein
VPWTDADPVIVWLTGNAVLAAPVDDVIEVAELDEHGMAHTRDGSLEPVALPGLNPEAARRAVVVRAAEGPAAIPADRVEGVVGQEGPVRSPPEWLAGVTSRHVRGLIRLDDGRIAAVLATEALGAS